MRPATHRHRFDVVPPAERYTDPPAVERRPKGRPHSHERGSSQPRTHHRSGGGAPGRGTILGYNRDKGFGFIQQEAGGKDVFFHRSNVSGAPVSRFTRGKRVRFALAPGEGNKLRAKTVEIA